MGYQICLFYMRFNLITHPAYKPIFNVNDKREILTTRALTKHHALTAKTVVFTFMPSQYTRVLFSHTP